MPIYPKEWETVDQAKATVASYLDYHQESGRGERYAFNIKLYSVPVPYPVVEKLGDALVQDIFDQMASNELADFAEGLRGDYDWVKNWTQAGRMGGWLVLVPKFPVLDVSEDSDPSDIQGLIWRSQDLREIDRKVRKAKRSFLRYVADPKTWRQYTD